MALPRRARLIDVPTCEQRAIDRNLAVTLIGGVGSYSKLTARVERINKSDGSAGMTSTDAMDVTYGADGPEVGLTSERCAAYERCTLGACCSSRLLLAGLWIEMRVIRAYWRAFLGARASGNPGFASVERSDSHYADQKCRSA